MRYRVTFIILIVFMTLASIARAEKGRALIRGTADPDSVAGTAFFEDTESGLSVNIQFSKAPAGKHGIHIHEAGFCEDKGSAAGAHFNPDSVEHGFVAEKSVFDSHPGDLGNILIGTDGTGNLTLVVEDLSLSEGLYNVAGRAVILHEKEDDFSQPAGNAGARIGCGTILMSVPQ